MSEPINSADFVRWLRQENERLTAALAGPPAEAPTEAAIEQAILAAVAGMSGFNFELMSLAERDRHEAAVIAEAMDEYRLSLRAVPRPAAGPTPNPAPVPFVPTRSGEEPRPVTVHWPAPAGAGAPTERAYRAALAWFEKIGQPMGTTLTYDLVDTVLRSAAVPPGVARGEPEESPWTEAIENLIWAAEELRDQATSAASFWEEYVGPGEKDHPSDQCFRELRDLAEINSAIEDVRAAVASRLAGEPPDELTRIKTLINSPITDDFDMGVPLEAAHQVERWGTAHDSGKEPQDWFWLVGYLAGKCLRAHIDGNAEKALHHTISTAAVLRNWHRAIRGVNDMRPGIDGELAARGRPPAGEPEAG